MNNQNKPSAEQAPKLTQHALLVAWGRYAQHIGLVAKLEQLNLG